MNSIRHYVATMALGPFAVAAIFTGLMFSPSNAEARDARVFQVPNGTVNSCMTCHLVELPIIGNGPRNPFGEEIEANYLTVPGIAGVVVWGAELAGLNSDGDAKTNGNELNDPTGTVFPGVPNPGDAGNVTNPGVHNQDLPIGSPWMITTLVSALTGAGYAITRRRANRSQA